MGRLSGKGRSESIGGTRDGGIVTATGSGSASVGADGVGAGTGAAVGRACDGLAVADAIDADGADDGDAEARDADAAVARVGTVDREGRASGRTTG